MTPDLFTPRLAEERPTDVLLVNLILFTLDVDQQTVVRHAARKAYDMHGSDGEVTVYNGFRYRLNAKQTLKAITEFRAKHGWKKVGNLVEEAARLDAILLAKQAERAAEEKKADERRLIAMTEEAMQTQADALKQELLAAKFGVHVERG